MNKRKNITVSEFINGQFKDYVNYDNHRNIPHLMDGLKVTQRKALFAFINDIGHSTIVVDKAGMRAADISKYHHGATSMIGVLVNMNQDFPGTNNLPLFTKEGQFGSRLKHKASSERYISTSLNDSYKKLFDADDAHILRKLYDDGDEIEPQYYLPKLPLLLINGSKGTGNGYASNVLAYDVDEIKTAVLEVLKTGLVQTKLTPFLNGYNGDIMKNHATGQVTFEGVIERKGSNTLIITELTPNLQLHEYKDHLNYLATGLKKDKDGKYVKEEGFTPLIKDYENESTEESWKFIIDAPRATVAMSDADLLKLFNLTDKDTENLTVRLPNGKLKRFATTEQLVEEWVRLRLEFYEERRLDKIDRLKNDQLPWLRTKLNFIEWWNKNAQRLVVLKKADLEGAIKAEVTIDDGYISRLLGIRISNLGIEELDALRKDIEKIEKEIQSLENTTNKKMMAQELKEMKL